MHGRRKSHSYLFCLIVEVCVCVCVGVAVNSFVLNRRTFRTYSEMYSYCCLWITVQEWENTIWGMNDIFFIAIFVTNLL